MMITVMMSRAVLSIFFVAFYISFFVMCFLWMIQLINDVFVGVNSAYS
jgi:hypothetical protein